MIWFVAGLFIGAALGAFLMALFAAKARAATCAGCAYVKHVRSEWGIKGDDDATRL